MFGPVIHLWPETAVIHQSQGKSDPSFQVPFKIKLDRIATASIYSHRLPLSDLGELYSLLCTLGDISIGIKCAPGVVGPAEADIDFDIIKNDNDTFTVKYTPPGPGRYTIMVLFADQVRKQIRVFPALKNSSKALFIYLFIY